MNTRLHYFGYGRTMNPVFMKGLCRHAKALCPAKYQFHRLTERRFADIDPDPASEVYGVLYSITPGDKKKLDEYAESLDVYAETEVEVEFGDEKIRALTYIMTPEGKKECDGIPYAKDYIGECRRGAAHYMVPNSFRYANAIIYGTQIDDELDAHYLKNAVEIRPCTVTGTIYDSGYNYPLFSPEGDTVVEVQFVRVPRDILEKKTWRRSSPLRSKRGSWSRHSPTGTRSEAGRSAWVKCRRAPRSLNPVAGKTAGSSNTTRSISPSPEQAAKRT